GLELRDAVAARQRNQVLEKQRPDATALILVGDGEGDLGGPGHPGPGGQHRVATDADDVLGTAFAQRRDERSLLDEVEAREVVELRVGQAALCAEEAVVDGARAQPVEVLDEVLTIVGADGTDENRAAVAEYLLGGILPWIGNAVPLPCAVQAENGIWPGA